MNLITHLKPMSVNKINIIISVLLSLGVLLSTSCKKTNENNIVNYDYGVKSTSDYASAQHLSISLANTYFKAVYDTSLINTGTSSIDGADVKYYPDSVFQLRIIYPSWGRDDGYGNWRQGEIHIQANGGFFNEDANTNFLFVDFSFTKDNIIAHNYSVKYLGENSFQIIGDSVCRFIDTTGVIVFNSQQIYTVILSDTNEFIPDQLQISGLLNGKSSAGSLFETSVNVDIISDLKCNWMKQGELGITYDSLEFPGTVYYNDISVCENFYNLIIDEVDFPSEIQKPKW